MTRPETLVHLSEHIKRFVNLNPQGVFIVALNKSDLIDPEQLEVWLKKSHNHQPHVLSIIPLQQKQGLMLISYFKR